MALLVSAPEIDVNTDLRVHAALVETCRNSYLVGECEGLLEAAASTYFESARHVAWKDTGLLESWVQEHQTVWESIAAGDAESAMRASRDHLLSVVHRFATDESLAAPDRARMAAMHTRFSQREPHLPAFARETGGTTNPWPEGASGHMPPTRNAQAGPISAMTAFVVN
jgi:hypothetical protein